MEDTILTLLFFGLLLAVIIERVSSSDSYEVRQFIQIIKDTLRRVL